MLKEFTYFINLLKNEEFSTHTLDELLLIIHSFYTYRN
jgi:hypothetical protein